MKEKNEARACALKTSIGGQALMEGIMMRGPKKTVMAVRNTKGEIVVEDVETSTKPRPRICRWPLIRGIFGYIDSMALGYKALMRSAELSGLEDIVEESPKQKKKREAKEAAAREAQGLTAETVADTASDSTEASAEKDEKKEDKLPAWVSTLVMSLGSILGVVVALLLFVWLPAQLFEWVKMAIPAMETDNAIANSAIKSGFEGVTRIILLIGYMSLMLLMKDIRRTFMYHGAEHKSIFCYEAGLELTVENVKKQRRFHPRCGTSFLLLMVLVSIIISFFIDPISIAISGHTLPLVFRVLLKLLLLPLIVGVGYELIKLAGRYDNWFTRAISAPGMWFQHITVFEPTDDMIECAIAALKPVIPQDGSDEW